MLVKDEMRTAAVDARNRSDTIRDPSSSPAITVQSNGPKKDVTVFSGWDNSEIRSITTSFAADVQSLSDGRWANAVNRQVELTDDHGERQSLWALLDTGANCNFISGVKASMLRLQAATRRLAEPIEIRAANGLVQAIYVVKGQWQFRTGTTSYTHLFYVVPDLEHEIVLGRHVIFEHGLLMGDIKLWSHNLLDEVKESPELLIMGMPKPSKGRRRRPLHLSVTLLTPTKPRRRRRMSDPRQRKGRTRHRGIRKPTRSGKGLQSKRRRPLRLEMPAVLPAAVGHPTTRNEKRGESEDLF